MKKILFVLLFFISITVKADSVVTPVTFTLYSDFYSEVIKSYENNTTVFYYKNNLLSMDLTTSQLKKILSQKPGNGSSRLTYYETLNIKVNPVLGTPFESLLEKSTFYRANGGGKWVSSLTHDIALEETATVKNLNNDFWPWGFRIKYRTNPNDSFTSTIPNGVDLADKTLEEQLAVLLDIDLETNPNGVVNEYQNLFVFSPLKNYTFLIRFDFLDGQSPVLKEGSSTDYLSSSLNNLKTYYVAIKYDRSDAPVTTFDDNKLIKSSNKIWITSILIVCGTVGCYIFCKKIYSIKKKAF